MGAIDASAGWFRNIYRGTYFQAILLGLVSFTQPGIWTAIMSLGGGGQAEPYGVNASDAITYGYVLYQKPSSMPSARCSAEEATQRLSAAH
ncbi:hypothetical protein FALCPG4_007512 [Fusarium falciforme]